MTTKAPAAALGWGGRSTGGWGGTAGTPRDALRSAVEIATALARRLSVPQCSAGHVRPAAGEMGARCSRECWPRKAVGYRSSALHRAARHLQRAHCARALARNDKAPGTRSEAAARCGNPGTGVPRTRPGRGRAAPLLARRRQAHRGSSASLPFTTTGHVPREELSARQRRRRQRRTSPPTGGAALRNAAPHSPFLNSLNTRLNVRASARLHVRFSHKDRAVTGGTGAVLAGRGAGAPRKWHVFAIRHDGARTATTISRAPATENTAPNVSPSVRGRRMVFAAPFSGARTNEHSDTRLTVN